MSEIKGGGGDPIERQDVGVELKKFRDYISSLKETRGQKDATLNDSVAVENLTEQEMKVWNNFTDFVFKCAYPPSDLKNKEIIAELKLLLADLQSLRKEIANCERGFRGWMNNRITGFFTQINFGIEDDSINNVVEAAKFEKEALGLD